MRNVILFCAAALAGCAAQPPRVAPPLPVSAAPVVEAAPSGVLADWRVVISADDRDRLERAAAAWTRGLREARAARFAAAIKDEGPLLDPAAALERPTPPPGRYQCRVIKLGKAPGSSPPFLSFPPYFCYLEADGPLTTLVKETGSERPTGRLWEDGDTRLVFLGAMVRGDETRPRAYGEDPRRDLAGIVERVGPFRWRLIMPWPHGKSVLDVIEMVPFTDPPKEPAK